MLYFIINGKAQSGKGAAVWSELKAFLQSKEIAFKAVIAKYPGHAIEIAAKISSLNDDDIRIVVVGGDGTINEVINGISDFSRVKLGVISSGSGNDFAKGLGMSKNPTVQLERILSDTERKVIDIGKVTWDNCEKPRYFAISSGIGLDALVCKKALTSRLKKVLNKVHLGRLTYLMLTVVSLFTMDTMQTETVIDGGKPAKRNKSIFTAAMNLRAEGGGVPMVPNAEPSDGLLSVCTISGIPKWCTFLALPFLVAAKHERIKGVEINNCKSYTVTTNKPVVLHADGEYVGDVMKVCFECEENKLTVIL